MGIRNLIFIVLFTLAATLPIAGAENPAFTDDFESGSYLWDLGEGWSIVEIDGNHVLQGTKHSHAVPDLEGVPSNFSARVKIENNLLHMNIRRTPIPEQGENRYFIGFNVSQDTTYINKQVGNTEQHLKGKQSAPTPDEWHDITVSIDGNRINVYVDDTLFIWARDPDEFFMEGGVGFETTMNSIVYIDDVRIETLDPSMIPLETPVTSKPPNVITKRISSGIVGESDGEIVFEVGNEDSQHQVRGYLSCDVPSDVVVTSAMGAATGEEAQYISSTFVIDPAPARESMSLRLSSEDPGTKYVRCTVNYVLFKEDKGYLNLRGKYKPDIEYEEITVNRDITFSASEVTSDEPQGAIAITPMYFIGAGAFVLVIIFLVYRVGMLTGKK